MSSTEEWAASPRATNLEDVKHDSARSASVYGDVERSQNWETKDSSWIDSPTSEPTAVPGDEEITMAERGTYREQLPPLYEVRPASPTEFGQLFPSRRKMLLQHDNMYGDGAMNLRMDMHSSCHGRVRERVTIFHLKINDIEKRTTSLRRYCRDSGREVCSSSRTYKSKRRESRLKLRTSLTSALASLGLSTVELVSANGADDGEEEEDDDATGGDGSSSVADKDTVERPLPSGISLDFSNYAHVELVRKRKGGDVWYEYDYWGTKYRWKAIPSVSGYPENCVYQLFCSNSARCLASIVPVPLTAAEALEEQAKGGWIDPCTLWIEDAEMRRHADVAETMIATGIMALIDDTAEGRAASRNPRPSLLRSASLRMDLEFAGPKRFFDEVLTRKRPRAKSHHSTSVTAEDWFVGNSR